jgi:hypothetical protein
VRIKAVTLRPNSEKQSMNSIAPHVWSIVEHDGAVILDMERDEILTLNATGGQMWDKLRQGKLIDEIARELAAETGADAATVDRDVRAFLDELKARHLLIA